MKDNKKEAWSSKALKKLFSFLFFVILIVAISYAITSALLHKALVLDLNIITSQTFLTILVVGFLLVSLWYLSKLVKGTSKSSSSDAKVKTKGDIKKYYDSNWISESDLRNNPDFKFSFFDNLKRTKNIGIPIRAEVVGNRMLVNMYDSIHTLVIGTTGSGKSTQFVDPTIQILSESQEKPCFVITDPKGDLYRGHSNKLKKQGYRVLVFDLTDPFKSTCWNPLARPYRLNQRANNLEKEILVHRNDNPRKYPHLQLASANYASEWYEFNGIAFADIETVHKQVSGLKQSLKTEAVEDLKDIAITLSPIKSTTDPIWESGAKDFILGVLLAMLEDSENPELGMTEDKFNFYNLSKIATLKDNDPFNSMKSITDYFAGRDPLSQASQLASQILSNAENTRKSYMGFVSDSLGLFSDMGVCYATHTNEMELTSFVDQPTALFIKIPDEKITRHPIASMFISQLYKVLVDVANKKGGKLDKAVYFILDEFANMPAIQNFETMITVARSRRIFFLLIIQSYAQLSIKYDEKIATTIKDNCNIHIYMASNDLATQKEFSERCGNVTIETESTTTSKGKKEEQSTTTTSVNLDTRPLIYPAELATLKDKVIVSILRQQPLKSTFTKSFSPEARKFYDMNPAKDEFVISNILDEDKIYYDIKTRNKKVLNTLSSGANIDFGSFDV